MEKGPGLAPDERGHIRWGTFKPDNLRVEADFKPLSLAHFQKLSKTEIAAEDIGDMKAKVTMARTSK